MTIIKYLLTAIVLFLAYTLAFSQIPTPHGYTLEVKEQTDSTILIQCNILHYQTDTVIRQGELFSQLLLRNAPKIIDKGLPELPRITTSVDITGWDSLTISYKSNNSKEIFLSTIIPAIGNRKHGQISNKLVFDKCYSNDAFFPNEIARVSASYIYRDVKGVSLELFPFQYQPILKQLKVHTNIQICLTRIGEYSSKPHKTTKLFNALYDRQFINYQHQTKKKRYEPINEHRRLLIITPSVFEEEVKPFAKWKRQAGFEVYIETFSEATNTEHIKEIIDTYYHEKNISFCLLIGDIQFVPTVIKDLPDGALQSLCDPALGYVDGNDYYPEVLIGRFSIENKVQLKTCIARSIAYEKNLLASDDWLSSYTLIASDDGPGDDGEFDYQHLQQIRHVLENYTYTKGSEFYDGSQGGLDAAGNPVATMLIDNINNGTGCINYIGHGSDLQFSTSYFRVSDINNLRNTSKWPFVFIVACESGDFRTPNCMAEALLRASHNENPTGAVAVLASSIEQDWDPPMSGHDEMVDIMCQQQPDNIKWSFGAIVAGGCAKMNEEYPEIGPNNAMTWTTFGDPSLMIRTKKADSMEADVPENIQTGETQLRLGCNTKGAIVTLLNGNELFSKSLVQSGNAILDVPQNSNSVLTLTLSAFNASPLIYTFNKTDNEKSFFAVKDYHIVDIEGNNNSSLDCGETVDLTVNLTNTNVPFIGTFKGELSIKHPMVEVLKSESIYSSIGGDETYSNNTAFKFKITEDIEDGEMLFFKLYLTDENDFRDSCYFSITANAPRAELNILSFEEKKGNGNNFFEARETYQLMVEVNNTGNADAEDIVVSLLADSDFLTITNSKQEDVFTSKSTRIFTFSLTATSFVPQKTYISLNINSRIADKSNSYELLTFHINPYFENWESGGFQKYLWEHKGLSEWTVTDSKAYNSSYSAQSGALTNDSESVLSIDIEVEKDDSISFLRKVSSETAFDYLSFYIDDILQGKWSGERDWGKVNFPVTTGLHTFKWIFSNDETKTKGENAAWIDDIVFPLNTLKNNKPPIFKSSPEKTILYGGAMYYYAIAYSDFDNDTLNIGYVQKPEWLNFTTHDNNNAILWGQATDNMQAENSVKLYLTDNINDTIYQDFTLKVFPRNVVIYPNPVVSVLNVLIESGNDEPLTIEIYHTNGKKLQSLERNLSLGLNKLQITCPYHNGMYLLKIIKPNGYEEHKLFCILR